MSERLTDRDEWIAAHRHLCRRAAARFVRPNLERSDLEQVAMLGLIKATHDFDASIGTPFVAFARRRIIGELMHYVRDHETLVRFPRSLHELHRREQKACVYLQSLLGRNPSRSEIVSELCCTHADLAALYAARYRCNVADLESVFDHDGASYQIDDRAMVLSSLRHLEHDERALVMAVYGLRLSQTEAGLRLGFTQRSASRIHKRALQKLSLALGEV